MDKQVRLPGGASLQFGDQTLFPEQPWAVIPDMVSPTVPPGGTLLKEARQRFVVRCLSADGPASFIAKIFPLSNIFSRLKYKKYALEEYRNLQEAKARGMSVPQAYAYLELRRFGLVRSCAVVLEDFRGWTDLKQIGKREGPLVAGQLAIPALLACYETGCHHIDGRDENILYSPDRTKFSIIDWQYASFTKPRDQGLLEHLAAFYIRKAEKAWQPQLVSAWLPMLASAAGMDDGFRDRVLKLLPGRQSLADRRARKI